MDTMSSNNQVRGRPLSDDVTLAVYQSALDLVADKGLSGTNRSEIAARASVSRQTLYNRWDSVGDIVLEALLERGESEIGATAGEATDDGRERLFQYVTGLSDALNGWAAPGLKAVAALAQQDPKFAKRFRENLLQPRFRRLREVVGDACAADDQNPELITELIAASMWHRLLISGKPLDQAWVNSMISLID